MVVEALCKQRHLIPIWASLWLSGLFPECSLTGFSLFMLFRDSHTVCGEHVHNIIKLPHVYDFALIHLHKLGSFICWCDVMLKIFLLHREQQCRLVNVSTFYELSKTVVIMCWSFSAVCQLKHMQWYSNILYPVHFLFISFSISVVVLLCSQPIGRITSIRLFVVCPSVPILAPNSKTKNVEKIKKVLKVPRGTIKWNANFQLKRSKVKVNRHQKPPQLSGIMFTNERSIKHPRAADQVPMAQAPTAT